MTTDPTLQQELADLFDKTGRLHHKAFIQTDGFDPDWPRWYASHLVDKLTALLNAGLTQDMIANLLVQAAEEMKMRAPEVDWTTYYARFFMEQAHELRNS
jgi:hypothetical protein